MGRLHSIEALRGLAALAVTWFHLTNTYDEGSSARISGSYGWLGVDCFFVISGFVIPYALHRANYEPENFWRFMARRLVRLEPPYLVSLALVVLLAYGSNMAPAFAGNDPAYTVGQLAAHLLYLIPLTEFDWAQPVYWSLAYEFVFYIMMGALFTVLWKCPLWVTASVSLAAFGLCFAATGAWDGRLLLFLFGIAAMRYFVGRDKLWEFLGWAVANTVLLLFVAPLTAAAGLATTLLLTFVRLPEWRPLTALGAISYSLYLTHVPVGGRIVNLGKRFLSSEAEHLALSLLALLFSLAFAWIFHKLVESGATMFSKRIALSSRASPNIASSSS